MEQSTQTFTPERLAEFLDVWRRPGGVLARDQLRALIEWSGTPDDERAALRESLATTEQQVEARPLAPNQRRGHVSFLDRVRSLLSR